MRQIAKQTLLGMLLFLVALPGMAESWLDIPYRTLPGTDQNLTSLDIHAPEGAVDAPVLIMVHGGGWRFGDKRDTVGAHQIDYFTRQGFVFVSINYRLAPDHPFPAHAEDAAAAIAYVQRRIAQYGGDPDSLSLMGHSAGAHIAALVSIDPSYLMAQGLTLGALERTVLLDGAAYDIGARARGGKLPRLYRGPFGDDPAVWHAASPAKQVQRRRRIPSILIVNVDRRQGHKQAKILHRALNSAGHQSKRLIADDRTHASLNKELGAPDDAYAPQITAFLHGN